MDIPGPLVVLLVLVIPALATIGGIALMRRYIRSSGHEHVINNGIVVTDDGIEYPGFLLWGTRKKEYAEIDSIDLIPYYKFVFLNMRQRFGHWTELIRGMSGGSLLGDIVVIKIKNPEATKHLLFQPKDAAGIHEQLKNRIKR
jgi:hypothetical protein